MIVLPWFVIVLLVACYKLFLPDSRVNCRQYFFAVRIITVWNSLPGDVVSADTLTLFRPIIVLSHWPHVATHVATQVATCC